MDSFWYYGIDGGTKWLLVRDNKGVLKYKINLTLIGLEHIKTYDELIEFVGVNEYPILEEPIRLKEVDLEKEVNNWRHKHFHGRRDKEADGEYLERVSQLDLAKHFFELGLKTQSRE